MKCGQRADDQSELGLVWKDGAVPQLLNSI